MRISSTDGPWTFSGLQSTKSTRLMSGKSAAGSQCFSGTVDFSASQRLLSAKSRTARPVTAGMSRVSTANSLSVKDEPFHVMTLREAATLTYKPDPSQAYKLPVSRK